MLIALRITGIVLLSVIAFIILLLLSVLFIPVRYKITAEGSTPFIKAKAGAHWLLHIISFTADFEMKKSLSIFVKLFGLKIFEKEIDMSGHDTDPSGRTEDSFDAIINSVSEDNLFEEESAEEEGPSTLSETELEEILGYQTEQSDDIPNDKKRPEDKFDELKNMLIDKFDNIKDSIKSAFQVFGDFVSNAKAKAKEVRIKIDSALEFKNDRENRAAFAYIIRKLKIFLYHIRPRYGRGYARLGLKDPALTAEIAGAYYSLFPEAGASGKNGFRVIAEFDEEVIECNAFIRGHIRLNHALALFISLWSNKTIRSWFKK